MKVKISDYDLSGEQEVNIRIDEWDTWNMDVTLAHVILPLMIQMKETQVGCPVIDDEDVPHLPKQCLTSDEGMQPDLFDCEEYDQLCWDQYKERWDWVLDEIIYVFDCKLNKDELFVRFEDRKEMRAEQDRISNGFRLFGKYYESFWK